MSRRQDHPGIDITKPSVPALVFLLHHREFWPEGFEWDYANCGTCAMGLAERVWCLKVTGHNPPDVGDHVRCVADAIDLDKVSAYKILFALGDTAAIQPEHVAAALDRSPLLP